MLQSSELLTAGSGDGGATVGYSGAALPLVEDSGAALVGSITHRIALATPPGNSSGHSLPPSPIHRRSLGEKNQMELKNRAVYCNFLYIRTDSERSHHGLIYY